MIRGLMILLCLDTLVGQVAAAEAVFRSGNIAVSQVWARAAPPVAVTGAGYFTVRNAGAIDDTLLAADAGIADSVSLHETRMANNVMSMKALTAGVELAAGTELRFEPGGMHLMFMGLRASLSAGNRFPVTLVFANAGKITVEMEVREP